MLFHSNSMQASFYFAVDIYKTFFTFRIFHLNLKKKKQLCSIIHKIQVITNISEVFVIFTHFMNFLFSLFKDIFGRGCKKETKNSATGDTESLDRCGQQRSKKNFWIGSQNFCREFQFFCGKFLSRGSKKRFFWGRRFFFPVKIFF